MSSQRDPRALEIRGAWLYSDRCSQQNHLKLSSPLCVAQWQRKVVYSIQLVRKEVMFFWYGLKKQKHKKPVAKITRNLIPSREWSFPKRWKVSKVGQKKTPVWPPVTWQDREKRKEEEEGDEAGSCSVCFYCPFLRKPVTLHNKLT